MFAQFPVPVRHSYTVLTRDAATEELPSPDISTLAFLMEDSVDGLVLDG
jgi:hypothetical protein